MNEDNGFDELKDILNIILISFFNLTLYKVNFEDANLDKAKFEDTVGRRMVLKGAKARLASFKNADMRDADMRGMFLSKTDFTDANLKGAKVSSLKFFKRLENTKCIGIKALSEKYMILPRLMLNDDGLGYYSLVSGRKIAEAKN